MRRGDVWLVDLEPATGSEANKTRPCVIVSNDHANARAAMLSRGTITVVPITSTVEPILAFHVHLTAESSGLSRDSKAQAEHVRSIDVRRIVHLVGHLPVATMKDLDAALCLHLDLI